MKGGTLWRQKNFEKKSHSAEKKFESGDSLVPFGIVDFLEKVKNERVPFGLSLPWRDLALGGFRIVSKKWTDQCEDCGLKKKTVTAIVGHFSLKRKAPSKNKLGSAQVGAISKAQKSKSLIVLKL